VERYLGYRLSGFPPGVHRGLPSRHLTFIVGIGSPIDVVAQTDPSQGAAAYRCVLSGLQASPALIAHDGHQEGVAIELTPVGCQDLFAVPAAALWNTTIELDELARDAGREIWERVQLADRWHERFAACDRVLTRLLERRSTGPVRCELRLAWRLLEESQGSTSIGELAGAVGWSRQHLRRRFTDEFGLAPKLAGRVIRFDHARHVLQAGAPRGLTIAGVASACGYFDQAHLNREFAELAGCTPTELLSGDLPSVQDPDRPAGAG
jgi:AraC-like DNA-binding protein